MTNYDADHKLSNGNDRDKNTFYSARLTSTSQKGNVWCRYNNVGTYNGTAIDLKITLADWTYLQPANTSASSIIGKVNYPTIFFNKKQINIQVTTSPAVDRPVFVYNFYKHGTNTPILVKCHETFIDVDNGEYFVPTSGFDKVYRNSGSNLKTFTTSKVGCAYGLSVEESERKNWATCLISGSSFKFTYTRLQDIKGNSHRDITTKVSATTRSIFGYAITSNSLAPFTFPDITKKVNKEEVFNEEDYYYTISQYIPAEDSSFYYDSYSIGDILAPCLEIIGDIEIIDELGNNKTATFNIKIEDVKNTWLGVSYPDINSEISKDKKMITIEANKSNLTKASFYNTTYYFKIPVRKKKDYDMNKYYTSRVAGNHETAEVYNGVSLNIERKSTSSFISNATFGSGHKAYAIVNIYGKISTEVINGTIDEGNEKVPLGSSNTIKYTPNEGYKLKSITVNGEDVDITKYPTEYTIDNLINNSNIKVVYEPIETPKGSITINKKNTDNLPLQNVTFELYDNNNNLIDTQTTNENGQILFENLIYGKFILIETKTAPGYELNKDKIEIELSDSNKNVEITIHNHQRTELPFAGGKSSILFIVIGFGLIMIAIIIITVIEKKK